MTLKFIDLFAGIGGFHYGIKKYNNSKKTQGKSGKESRSGSANIDGELRSSRRSKPAFSCVYSNEWNKYASSVYKKHYEKCDTKDIRKVDARTIPDHDLLVGGFPCQAFSVAGKRAGFNDTRGTLFFDVARILKEKRPRYFILENVKGLLTHDNGQTFKTILTVLTDVGYDVQWQVFNSRAFGVPQNRERIYIIGNLRGETRPKILFTNGEITENTRVGGNDEPKKEAIIRTRHLNQNGRLTSAIVPTLQATEIPHVIDNSYPSRARVYDKYAPTLRNFGSGGNKMPMVYNPATIAVDMKAQGSKTRRGIKKTEYTGSLDIQCMQAVVVNEGELKLRKDANCLDANYHKGFDNHGQRTGVLEGVRIRRLTPIECERLQGFPDDYTKFGEDGEIISDTQRYKMLGNAVTTNVITEIVKMIYESIQG